MTFAQASSDMVMQADYAESIARKEAGFLP